MLFFIFSLALADSEHKAAPSKPKGQYVHFQSFAKPGWEQNYFASTLPQYTGEWELANSNFPPYEKMIYTKTPNARYSLSTTFESPLNLHDEPLIIQYEVHLQESLTCGGATLKLYGKDFNPDFVSPTTPYIIQFGPDRCGSTNKVIFNFRHKDSKTGVVREHKLVDCPQMKNDKFNHLYTLIIRPDNTFEILIDSLSVKEGSLLQGFQPEVNPPAQIEDPNDKKPSDWVENEKIPDPNARKPDDWDETQPEFIPNPAKLNPPKGWLVNEPAQIPDPKVTKPSNWDDEFFGPWEAPLIDNPVCENARGCGKYYPPAIRNPKYKGKWKAPEIKNPAYKGKWAPRKIPNPNYYQEKNVHNFDTILGLGFEFSSASKGVGFGNVLVATTEEVVHTWNRQTFFPKRRLQNIEAKKVEPKAGSPEFPSPVVASSKPEHKVHHQKVEKKEKQQQPVQQSNHNDIIAQVNQISEVVFDKAQDFYNFHQILAIIIVTTVVSLPFILFITSCFISTEPTKHKSHGKMAPSGKGKITKVIYVYDNGEIQVLVPSEKAKNKTD